MIVRADDKKNTTQAGQRETDTKGFFFYRAVQLQRFSKKRRKWAHVFTKILFTMVGE